MKITRAFIKSVTSTPGDYWESGSGSITGLHVRVREQGSITLRLKYNSPVEAGKRRIITLCKVDSTTDIERMRADASVVRVKIDNGIDPHLEKAGRIDRAQQSIETKIAAMCEVYLARYARVRKRPLSVKDDELIIKGYILPNIGHIAAHDLTSSQLQTCFDKISFEQNRCRSASKFINVVSMMYRQARFWGHPWDSIKHNPATGIQRHAIKARTRYLSLDEVRALIAALHKRDNSVGRWVVEAALYTGARVGELRAMQWSDIDFKERIWRIPPDRNKTKIWRHIPLNHQMLALLQSIKKHRITAARQSPYVFPGDRGPHIMNVETSLLEAAKDARLVKPGNPDRASFSTHDLRRTFACHLLLSGTDIYTVSKLLGHSSVATTEKHYAFLGLDFLRMGAGRLDYSLPIDSTSTTA